MRRIEPTHIEIMKSLNCVHYGCYDKNKCICTNPYMFKSCYEKEKRRLTEKIYTANEIAEQQKNNNKAMQELKSFLNEFEI